MAFTTRPATNGQAPAQLNVAGSDSPVAPPHNRDAEEAVVGAVFKHGLALADVVTFLKPQHFYHPPYRYVYAAMVALFERGASIDYHTVAAELEHRGTFQAAGGLIGLAELNIATPTSAHITYYAQIVADHALRRRFIDAAQQVAELAWDVRQEVETVRQRSEALVLGAATDTLSGQEVLAPEAWTDRLLDYLEQNRTGGLAGASTGLKDLDTMTLGLSPGLYLLAASTGTGKTAVAGQIALHVAEQHGPVVFVSMELTDVDLGVRLVSVLTNIKKEKLVVGALSQDEHVAVHGAVERMARSQLYLVYGSGYTTGDVRAHLLRAQAAEGVKPALLVVDYVQLLTDQEGDGRSRERNVSAAAKGLKNLSGELGVPVLALVQLNRNRAGRSDKRPTLTDLRESGDLENTADSVIGLYRHEMDHPDSVEKGLAELIVLKKRQLGDDVGTIRRVVWVGESYRDFAGQSGHS
jgi:replicative DNA helicase